MRLRTPFATFLLTISLTTCQRGDRPPAAEAAAATPKGPRTIAMELTADGFRPDALHLKAHEPVTLVVTRTTDETCATELLIDGTDIRVALPLGKPVEVAWTPHKAGTVKFGCAMDMMVSGRLIVE